MRSPSTARRGPASAGLDHPRRCYVVRLAGREFAIDATCILEILQLRGQELLPSVPCGLLHHRLRWQGVWLPVGIPHAGFRLTPRPVNARTCLLIAERRLVSGASVRFGVYVDSLSRIAGFPAASLRRVPADTERRNPYSEGLLRWNGKWHHALDLEALFPDGDLLGAVQSPNAA